MDNTDEITKYLDKHLSKITEDRYFLECYPDCKNTPAWFIKTEPTELVERNKAIQHYVNSLLNLLKYCPKPTKTTIAMYIPSHDKDVFSNCGKVVAKVADGISWLIDGTQYIKRSRTICAKHKSLTCSFDEKSQHDSLAINADISGKNIILFDDRITRGNTANLVSDLLYSMGADHVWFIGFDLTDRQAIFTRTQSNEYIIKMVLGCEFFEFKLRRYETNYGFAYLYGTDEKNSVRILQNNKVYATLNGKEYKIIQIYKQQRKQNTFVGRIVDNK